MADQIKQLRLSDLTNTRKSIARIIRYLQTCPENEMPRYRLINAYMTNIIACFKIDFESRLEALEKVINENQNFKN